MLLVMMLEKFCKGTMDALNEIAPIKKEYVHGIEMSFMTKQPSEEIVARLRLRNNDLIDKTDENRFL